MRTVKFRDVLWAPTSSDWIHCRRTFTNEAVTIGVYIDQWVRRLYSSQDWSEWTKIKQCAPDANHIVSYEQLPVTTTDTELRTFEDIQGLPS
jgi:hypothetical protein